MIKVYLTLCLGVNHLASNKVELVLAGIDKIDCWIMSHGIMPGQYLLVAFHDKDVAIYKIDYHHQPYQISGKTDLLIDATNWIDVTAPYKPRIDFVNNVLSKLFTKITLQDLIDNPELFQLECDIKSQVLNCKAKGGEIIDIINENLRNLANIELKNQMEDDLLEIQKINKSEPVFIDWGNYTMSQTNQIATD